MCREWPLTRDFVGRSSTFHSERPSHRRRLVGRRWGVTRRRLLLVLFAAGLLLVAASAPAQPAALVVQVATEPPGLDLTASPASAIAAVVFYNVQECLVKVDQSGKLVPWLAERWYTTDDRNYTFFLKRGVRFHNGRELQAADVKFSIERAMNPDTKHPYPQFYAAIGDIVVKDDYTVSVFLKTPSAAFLYNMARQGSVTYPHAL